MTSIAADFAQNLLESTRPCDAVDAITPAPPDNRQPAGQEPKQKRSTEKGEARVKIIPALTHHHKYGDGGCLNTEPIGARQLARAAVVAVSTVSDFFKHEFGGHSKYRGVYCTETVRLTAALKMLNGDYSVDLLFGGTVPEQGKDEADIG
jgi:hypothetical protein